MALSASRPLSNAGAIQPRVETGCPSGRTKPGRPCRDVTKQWARAARALGNGNDRALVCLFVHADHAGADGVEGEPDPIADGELVQDVVQMRLHRHFTDLEA